MDYLDDKLPSFEKHEIPDINKYKGLVPESFRLFHGNFEETIAKRKQKQSTRISKTDPRRNSLAWKMVYPDKRGKHDREYRTARKIRLESWVALLNPIVSCDGCHAMDYVSQLFTPDGYCFNCGLLHDEHISHLGQLSHMDRIFTNIVIYDPVFYLKEGLNNWRCRCPTIPNEHFKLIIQEIFHSFEDPRNVNARDITRTVIYNAVNRLFGASPWKGSTEQRLKTEQENRRFLVYRERWLFIKRWICQQPEFGIKEAHEWLERYRISEPNDYLIEKLEQMMKVIHCAYKQQDNTNNLNKKKSTNRPRRDVCILFLLYGLHPGLSVIYGTDFWKPPTTPKSRLNNTKRFLSLLEIAKQLDPLNYWPPSTLTLEYIEQMKEEHVPLDQLPLEIAFIFPFVPNEEIVKRVDYELF